MSQTNWYPSCPTETAGTPERLSLAHGEGGRATRQLLERHIVPRFPALQRGPLGDAALLPAGGPWAFTTDGYVVSPLFFPGGDIGSLAVLGTANDLAVMGARPRWLTLSMIAEEGLELSLLDRVLDSVVGAAARAAIEIVGGDFKVVPRGAVDRLFLNTSGVGELHPLAPATAAIAAGDRLLVSGPLGRHGAAILAAREELGLSPAPVSDCGPLWPAVESLFGLGRKVHALRDATRGGAAAVWQEWATASGLSLLIEEQSLPISGEVRGMCELLGLDPVYLACEGTMVAAVAPDSAEAAVATLRKISGCEGATIVGEVRSRGSFPVTIRRALGRETVLDEPSGAPLPRIC